MLCQVSLKGRELGGISVLVRILYPFVLLDLSFIRVVSIYRAPAMCSRQSNDPKQRHQDKRGREGGTLETLTAPYISCRKNEG